MVILHDILNLFVTTNTDNEIPSFIWFVSPILQSSMHLEFPQIVEVWKIFISLLYTSVYFLPWFHFVKLLRFLFISLAMVSLMRSQTRTSFFWVKLHARSAVKCCFFLSKSRPNLFQFFLQWSPGGAKCVKRKESHSEKTCMNQLYNLLTFSRDHPMQSFGQYKV